jgi:hypothetical protein
MKRRRHGEKAVYGSGGALAFLIVSSVSAGGVVAGHGASTDGAGEEEVGCVDILFVVRLAAGATSLNAYDEGEGNKRYVPSISLPLIS